MAKYVSYLNSHQGFRATCAPCVSQTIWCRPLEHFRRDRYKCTLEGGGHTHGTLDDCLAGFHDNHKLPIVLAWRMQVWLCTIMVLHVRCQPAAGWAYFAHKSLIE